VASTGELDESIVYGPGLRWAAMGTNLIYHLAGGESGMRHMLAQFGPCLKWPWTKLEAPELTDRLIDRMVEGTQAQAAGRSIREIERLRDDSLVAIQQVLRQYNIGAGATLRALEERLYADAARGKVDPAPQELTRIDTQVRPEWVDYNGHMTDFRYVQLFGEAMDALYRRIGIDDTYRRNGRMFYTVATQISYLAEAKVSDPLFATVQVMSVDNKRLKVAHRLHRSSDHKLIASGEQTHVHVNTRAGKATAMDEIVYHKLESLCAAQARTATA
jgi:carnitine 3-dehydrogenase